MRALKLLGNRQAEIVDVPQPELEPGRVLVRLEASAICGSEMHGFLKDADPVFLNTGHEGAGVVEDPGDSTRLKKGDRVGMAVVHGCGTCRWCRQGKNTLCANHRVHTSLHQELSAVPEVCCYPLPDDIPMDIGTLVTGDGFGVPFHSSPKLGLAPAETLAVFGCGPIGLGHVLLQSYLGAEVFAVDVRTDRLDLARELGAAHTIDAGKGNAADTIRELTGDDGVKASIEAAGRPETLEMALACVEPEGTVLCSGEQAEFKLSPSAHLIRRDITLKGAWFYHVREIPGMIRMVCNGFPLHKLITHHFPLDRAQEAYSLFADGRAGKVILTR